MTTRSQGELCQVIFRAPDHRKRITLGLISAAALSVAGCQGIVRRDATRPAPIARTVRAPTVTPRPEYVSDPQAIERAVAARHLSDGYSDADALKDAIAKLTKAHPAACRAEIVGISRQGRPIHLLRLQRGEGDANRSTMALIAGIDGDWPISTAGQGNRIQIAQPQLMVRKRWFDHSGIFQTIALLCVFTSVIAV